MHMTRQRINIAPYNVLYVISDDSGYQSTYLAATKVFYPGELMMYFDCLFRWHLAHHYATYRDSIIESFKEDRNGFKNYLAYIKQYRGRSNNDYAPKELKLLKDISIQTERLVKELIPSLSSRVVLEDVKVEPHPIACYVYSIVDKNL